MNNKIIFCLLVLVLLSVSTAFCQGTFTATGSGPWNTSGNWDLVGVDADGIPDADDTATIPAGITINMTSGTSYQIASLFILSGGTLTMNNANAVLDIVPNGGILQIDFGGVISNPVINDGNQINFLATSSFINEGSVQTDLLDFEGLNQTVTITGAGTLLVGGFRVSSAGVTIDLNTTGSFGSDQLDLAVDLPNFTINGTGTIDIGGDQDLVLSSTGLSIGCHMNINVDGSDANSTADGDIEIIANGSSLTITNGGVVVTGDDVRVGGVLSANNSTIIVDNGGELNVGDDINFNDNGDGDGGSADGFILTNNGTISVVELLEFNSETSIAITNNNLFTIYGNIISVAAASSVSFTNGANATFITEASIDADMVLDFTAVGNTVNYRRGDGVAQTIRPTTYYHLTLSGAGSKATGGNFTLLGNWTNTGVTLTGTNTITFGALAGTAAQTISAVGGETFYRLTINSAFATSPQIILNNPVTVINTLNMVSGIVNLNGNQFTLGSSGVASDLNRTTSTTTNWMYGGSFRRFWLNGVAVSPVSGNLYGVFPLGASTASSYRPLLINTTVSPTADGSYTATHNDLSGATDLSPFFDDDPTAGVINIVRKHNAQFIGSASGVTGGTYNISITMTGLPAGTLSDIRLAVSNGATTVTTVGTHFGAAGTAQNPTAARTGVAIGNLSGDFRVVTINATATPLPVELISFKGEVVKDAIQLNWETASELNNDFFTVERSTGGEIFSSIGQINGSGTTSHGNKYELIDHNPISGIAYYRLKQTDFDGSFTYSKIIDVTYVGPTVATMDVFPNPSAGEFTIKISGLKNMESVPVVMVDQLGRECIRLSLNVDENSGIASKTFTSQNALPQGMYILKAGSSLIKRFVVNSK